MEINFCNTKLIFAKQILKKIELFKTLNRVA